MKFSVLDDFTAEKSRNVTFHTLAVVGATPSPVWLFTAKALAIHDVMVSGTVVVIFTVPSAL